MSPSTPAGAFDAAKRYDTCLLRIYEDPQIALEFARGWMQLGGGAPAAHCAALALIESGQADRGAEALETVARRPDAGDAMMRARLLDQAAAAWTTAGQPKKALGTLDAAIRLAPDDPSLLVERARVWVLISEWEKAAADAAAAAARDAEIPEAWTMLARAQWALDRRSAAVDSLQKALALDPDDVAALLLRGEMRQAGVLAD